MGGIRSLDFLLEGPKMNNKTWDLTAAFIYAIAVVSAVLAFEIIIFVMVALDWFI